MTAPRREGRVSALRAAAAEWAMTIPPAGWLVVFFVVPTLMIVAVAFRPSSATGGVGEGWTLAAWRALLYTPAGKDGADVLNYGLLEVVWRTVWMSAAATAASLALAVPIGYCLARLSPRRRAWVLLLIVVPFWTNFLIRVYAWQALLHPSGFVYRVFRHLGWMTDADLFNGPGTVLLVMVYSYLPFAILPIYAAAEKFDFQLLDAARDLGATGAQAFRKAFLPGIRGGMENASLMVLIPCLGAYVIPKMMGSVHSPLLGNRIAQSALSNRNLPQASALATLLILMVLTLLLGFAWLRRPRPAARAPRP